MPDPIAATPAPAVEAPAAPAAQPSYTESIAAAAALLGVKEEISADPATEAKPAKSADPVADVAAKPAEPVKPPEPAKPSPLEQIAAERAALRKEKEERRAQDALLKEYEEIKTLSKSDKTAVLGKLGMTFAELTEAVLAGDKKAPAEHPEVKAVREELAAMKAKMAETEKAEAARTEQATAVQAAAEIESLAKASPEKFGAIAGLGLAPNVYSMIRTFQTKYGELPGGTVDAALEWAMTKVEETAQADIDRVLQLPSVKARLAPVAAKPAVPSPQASVGQVDPAVPRSLSNTQVSSAPPAPDDANTTDRHILVARAAKLLGG